MRIKMLLNSAAVVISLICVHQAPAQTFLDTNGSDFTVGWSSSAALSQVMPG
jgi:hypothetical protein